MKDKYFKQVQYQKT